MYLALIMVSGIGCQWISAVTRFPSIFLLLLAGILLGPVTGLIDPDAIFGNMLTPITSLSVAIILFEGGLSLHLNEVKKIGLLINSLVTVGTAVSIIAIFLFLYYAVGYSFEFSLLESAILVITGPTVIAPVIDQIRLEPTLRSILKWEGIIVEPIGAIAAVIIFEGIIGKPGHDAFEIIFYAIAASLIFGVSLGIIGALVIIYSLKKYWIPASIHIPVILMMLFIVFTISNAIHTDLGLIAVTIMGFILGNQKKVEITHIVNFKESLSIILISILFISLSGTIKTDLLIAASDESIALLFFMILVVRPLAVFCSGAFWKLKLNEAFFMCCIAPRGIVTAAVASLFGLELEMAGYSEAYYLAPIAFGIIIGTVVFYSFFTPFSARFLGIELGWDKRILIIGANRVARAIGKVLLNEGYEVQLIDPNFRKVIATKRSLLPVFRGTFLEYETKFLEKIENIDVVFALTENNDINSLAIAHLRRYVDDSKLYQLSASTEKIQESLMGQRLFDEKHDFAALSALLAEGYRLKSTNLSPSFTLSDWEKKHQGKAFLLFQIGTYGELTPQTLNNPINPNNSGKIIYMDRS